MTEVPGRWPFAMQRDAFAAAGAIDHGHCFQAGSRGCWGGPTVLGGDPSGFRCLQLRRNPLLAALARGWVPVIQERILGIHPTFVSHRIPCDFLPIGSATWKASVSSDFPERRTADPDRIMCFLFWTSENSMSTFVPFQTPFEV